MNKLKEEKRLHEEDKAKLEKLLYEMDCMVLEINKHLSRGGKLLGIHKFKRKKQEGDSESPENIFNAYYMLHTYEGNDAFHLRGYVVGTQQPYMGNSKPKDDYVIDHMFRIDGMFRYNNLVKNSFAIQIDHVDTKNPYKMMGLARQGFNYLKAIAIEYKAGSIYGNMKGGTREIDDLSSFYRKMGFELFFHEGNLPSFYMEFPIDHAS